MILWGILLGFAYQIFLGQTERRRSLWGMILFYLFAGLLCFLMTALFLYVISGGKWGIYGFLAMVSGFFFYYQWLRPAGRKASGYADRTVSAVGRAASFFGEKTPEVFLYPFGKIVDKGEKWIEKKEQKRRQKRAKKETGENRPH